ncbi:hypothetical protein FB446DRAFT_815874 [Lentinula raphanica]|uniref:Uncharacterized protein n=1 Tax=Lentinula raphanica TaxID=153919 RepID=A0AA38P0S1_9AGAR|nr:hypothetical protein FB446DRAFT_815874 [Lentinula raphanica]KAJ3826679.1 hypothetical protein F5880DRAFT_1610016 [Lentinula raphanica]KAJ3834187.1 hypothetical protein F5878DRAFT_664991 [Lentinula raphanica]
MGSTALLLPPHKIFHAAPPPPPHWPVNTSLTSSPSASNTSSSVQWQESRRTLRGALSGLQRALGSVHKRKIRWLVENHDFCSNLTPNEYLMMLLQPITDIFNQLKRPEYLEIPMKCVPVDLGHSICGVTFVVEEFKDWNIAAPIVVTLPGDLFDPNGKTRPNVESALSLAAEVSPSATIIITNFTEIAIFLPSSGNRPEPTFERVSTTQPSLALRVLTTAYLLSSDPMTRLLNTPFPGLNFEQETVVEGPLQNPHQLLSDAELFATHHRHSDFDMVTLVRDRARTLQFFRWHEHMSKTLSKVVAHPHDTLTAKAKEVGLFNIESRPIYPFDVTEIPPDTAAHLEAIQRTSPLAAAGVETSFKSSKSFTIKIQDVVNEGSESGICTVYRCQITTIDNVPVSTPSLCLKLFDDRFQPLHGPEDDELDQDPSMWLSGIVYAELGALNESFAYEKLLPVQGSIVPWFYGAHQFTLPDGTILYGLLMEYIGGWSLESDPSQNMSPERQITVIQSCRHAARVLDIADIAQCDWHNEQLLLCTNPVTKLDHAVLIDFASTMQTWKADEPVLLENFIHMFRILLGLRGDSGLDPDLVWKHYGEPDDWDPVFALIPRGKDHKEMWYVHARDMFDYISPVPSRTD